jgi:hypothetical protein
MMVSLRGILDCVTRFGAPRSPSCPIIAEGFERGGTGEFVQFLAIAKGSAGEIRAQLYVALDQSYIDRHQFDELIEDVDEVSRMISGLLSYLRRSGIKGTRFKR